jgi:lactate permease
MFHQIINPIGAIWATALVALVPLAILLILLVWMRRSAWVAALISSIITFLIGWLVWGMPFTLGIQSWVQGGLTGIWSVDWITIWGVVLFNTLMVTGGFDRLRNWLIAQGTADIRIQTLLFAWAFGALLEGLVGFGYPWAVVAPLLISLKIPDLDAIRVAAIANNAPVSFGALGVPIIALASITGLPLMALSSSIGHIVAVLALVPPWILIFLVAGWRGIKDGWPLAIVGSLAYIAGQFPVAVYLGPYLPDVIGSIVCFVVLLAFIRVWQPKTVLGWGGEPVADPGSKELPAIDIGELLRAWMPFLVLIVVVVAWTGPWSNLPSWRYSNGRWPPPRRSPTRSRTRPSSSRRLSAAPPSWPRGSLQPRCCACAPPSLARFSAAPSTRCGAPAWSAFSSSRWPMSTTIPVWRPRWPTRWLTSAPGISYWRRSLA